MCQICRDPEAGKAEMKQLAKDARKFAEILDALGDGEIEPHHFMQNMADPMALEAAIARLHRELANYW